MGGERGRRAYGQGSGPCCFLLEGCGSSPTFGWFGDEPGPEQVWAGDQGPAGDRRWVRPLLPSSLPWGNPCDSPRSEQRGDALSTAAGWGLPILPTSSCALPHLHGGQTQPHSGRRASGLRPRHPPLLPPPPQAPHSSFESQLKNHLSWKFPRTPLTPSRVAAPAVLLDFPPLPSRAVIACVPVGSSRKGTISKGFLHLHSPAECLELGALSEQMGFWVTDGWVSS